jgi:hypothetical protein
MTARELYWQLSPKERDLPLLKITYDCGRWHSELIETAKRRNKRKKHPQAFVTLDGVYLE